MKNIFSVLIATFILSLCVIINVNAESTEKVNAGHTTFANVSDKPNHCFVNNEFYRLFCDTYFEHNYQEYTEKYNDWSRAEKGEFKLYNGSDGKGRMFEHYFNEITGASDIFYSTVILDYDGDISYDKNMSVAESLYKNVEILYVGTTTPCVVIKIEGGAEDIFKLADHSFVAFVTPAFENITMNVVNAMVFVEEYKPDAADARKILRYSAGLDNAPENRSEAKKFFFMSDTDYDGNLTASDARTALRIAAGLEKGHTFSRSDSGLGDFWSL